MLYLQLIISRRDEILATDCEMSSVHGLLSKIPESIDVEYLIAKAIDLFKAIPPNRVASKGNIKLNSRSAIISNYYKPHTQGIY